MSVATAERCGATTTRALDPQLLTVDVVWPGSSPSGHVATSLTPRGCAAVSDPAPLCAWLTGWDPPPRDKALLATLGVTSMRGARLATRGGELTEVLLTMPSAQAARRLDEQSQACLGVAGSGAPSVSASPGGAVAEGGDWTVVRSVDRHVVALTTTGVPLSRAGDLAMAALDRAG